MTEGTPARRKRVDAQRNVGALLEAATTVFARSGVDAPAKEITDLAGVGVGTLYRHFPLRSDLVVAVLHREIEACVEAGAALRAAHGPRVALATWVSRLAELIGAKRGLAAALHSGDPAFEALPGYFLERLEPVAASLLTAAADAGDVRTDVDARDLLFAVALLASPAPGRDFAFNQRMVAVFVDGLVRP